MAARPVLKGEERIELRRDTITTARAPRPTPKALVGEEDEPLLAALKAKRRALAEAMRAPAYVVFPDRTLIEMATRKPRTLDEFAALPGVGAKKLETYGRTFLEVITGEAPAPAHPARRRLAGRDAGALFDRLQEAQLELERGENGTEKPLRCPAAQLARLAELRPVDMDALARIIGAPKAERFGPRFLQILNED